MKEKLTLTLLFCAVLMLTPSLLLAWPVPWQSDFAAQYPKAPAVLKTCLPCHQTSSGGSLDSYGDRLGVVASTVSGQAALVKIESEDSDGDGYTNLTEIQGGKDPGDAAQVPAKLLFYDTYSNALAAAIPNWNKAAGTWAGKNKTLVSTSTTKVSVALANQASLQSYTAGTLQTKLLLVASPKVPKPNASVIFSYVDNKNYRYAQLTNQSIDIGQVGTVGSDTSGSKKSAVVNVKSGTWHKVAVKISATGLVQVYLDGAAKPNVSHKFATTEAGRVGCLSNKSTVKFDDFTASK